MLSLFIFIIFSLAWLIHGFTGFGAAVIFTAALPIFIDAKTVIVSGGVGNLVGTMVLSSKNFNRAANFRILLPLLSFSLIGVFLGVQLLAYIQTEPLKIILGITLITIGSYDFLVQTLKITIIKFRTGYITASLVGMVAGFITGLLGTGGPLFVIYMNQTIDDKSEFKLLLSVIFFLHVATRLLFYLLNPELRQHFDPLFILASLPAIFAGVIIGNRLTARVNNERFKIIVSLSIVLLGFYTVAERLVNG